jgi:CRP-like cAMP-binding protein
MSAAVLRRFEARQIIVNANDPGTHLFLIKAGTVDYYRLTSQGHQVLIMQLARDDNFGPVSMLAKPVGYMGTAEATRETLVYAWEHIWIRHFIAKEPRLMENAFRIALEHIKLYSDRHLALVSENAEDRLRKTLALLEIQGGHRHLRGLEVEITNERLSSLADVGYYTTSRVLNKWQKVGAIRKNRGKVVILRPEKMVVEQD